MSEQDRYYPKLTINYDQDDNRSVFGEPDPVTLDFIQSLKPGGIFLDLAAGDGRYTQSLLQQGRVIANDIEPQALRRMRRRIADSTPTHLIPAVFSAFDPLPIGNNSLDGVVCAAFLYLYPPEMLKIIFANINSTLKSSAPLIVEFATDIRREASDGSLIKGASEVNYTLAAGMATLHSLYTDNGFWPPSTHVVDVHQDLRESAGYIMQNRKIVARGIKN